MFRLLAVSSWIVTAYCVGRAGILQAAMFQMAVGDRVSAWSHENLVLSLWYTVPILVILLGHECGHVLAARRYGHQPHWPYLLPWPLAIGYVPYLPAVGTLGAFTWCRLPPKPSSIEQWDIASAGVLTGAALSGVCVVVGGWLSVDVAPVQMSVLWEPAIIRMVTEPTTAWHPLLMAGWVGCVFTAINLIAVWPLDGWTLLCAVGAGWRRRRWSVAAVLIVGVGCLA